MGRIAAAFRLFFRTLGNRDFAEQAQQVLEGQLPKALPPAPPPPPQTLVIKAPPARSDALNLLAVLQREGRLIDFLKEDLSGYSDAQIGAAVRDIHRDCAATIERLFAPTPVRAEPEGSAIDVPPGFDASSIRLTGNVAGQPPYRGRLQHGGWKATKVEVPEWSGPPEAANIIAPAEVEIS